LAPLAGIRASLRCPESKDINSRRLIMFRVLTILAAVVALAVSAAPASAAWHDNWSEQKETYLELKLENVQITNYQLGVLDNSPASDDF
jgi:hypothetical protein